MLLPKHNKAVLWQNLLPPLIGQGSKIVPTAENAFTGALTCDDALEGQKGS
ncbi:hypothetical protein [Arthrobacter sp. CDRTa11]|uniref:hypothetical protein n=1 Tax=Arthrobacter sp. CDRTa11 TaxID=2651199 RepID=UPI002265C013|nr:hypothetical protein [Arthrobacter sp. CDRTa11]